MNDLDRRRFYAKRLWEIRKTLMRRYRKPIGQGCLAKMLDVTQSTVSRYLCADMGPSQATAQRIDDLYRFYCSDPMTTNVAAESLCNDLAEIVG